MATRTRAWLSAGDGHCLFPEGSGGGHEGFAWNSPLGPSALRGRDRQRTRRTTSEGQFRARIRASSNLAESFLSHDLSPSPSPNPPPPHISRLIVIAVIVVVVVSRGGRSFSPSQTRTTMQSVRDKSYFVLRVPLPAPPVIVAMDIYIFFLPFLSFSVSPPSTDNPSVTRRKSTAAQVAWRIA